MRKSCNIVRKNSYDPLRALPIPQIHMLKTFTSNLNIAMLTLLLFIHISVSIIDTNVLVEVSTVFVVQMNVAYVLMYKLLYYSHYRSCGQN